MSSYQRPWWLIVNRPTGLITTVKEETSGGERVFIIRGEPLVQGLAWLTWGPVAALLSVLLLAVIAVTFEVKTQPGAVRGLVIVAFLMLPALAWFGTTLILTRLSHKPLQAERRADRQECIIRLNQNRGELSFQTAAYPQGKKVAYSDIRQVKTSRPIGGRDSRILQLTLETEEGTITLLDQTLGTQAQKVDLVNEIEKALKNYADQ